MKTDIPALARFRQLATLLFFVAAAPLPAWQAEPFQLDKAKKAEMVDTIATAFIEHYVFPEVGEKMAAHLRQRLQAGAYDPFDRGEAMAEALTQDLRAISKDLHIGVRFMETMPPDQTEGFDRETYRKQMSWTNFGFHRVEILPGNVGYVDLRGFVDASLGGATATAAMNFLANTQAIIFDLRQNGGGSPSMIQHISSYLFEEPVHLNTFYIRESDSHRQFWTAAHPQGPRMAGIPVYVLTSRSTFSAAEEFTYNLKNMERATIIGETTGGGAHPVNSHRFDSIHMVATIPFGRAINPITGTNWEGTGVTPDIEVAAEKALDRAHLEALKKIKEHRQDDPGVAAAIDWAMDGLGAKLSPYEVPLAKLKQYAGSYGPRLVTLDNGDLYYQRDQRQRRKLAALKEDIFLVDGLEFFRIQFERDEAGKVNRLRGLYNNGHSDANDRDGEAVN